MPKDLDCNFVNVGDTEALVVTFDPAGIEEMFYEMGCSESDPNAPPPDYTPAEIKQVVAITNRYSVADSTAPAFIEIL